MQSIGITMEKLLNQVSAVLQMAIKKVQGFIINVTSPSLT
jgi:hypothetical protein